MEYKIEEGNLKAYLLFEICHIRNVHNLYTIATGKTLSTTDFIRKVYVPDGYAEQFNKDWVSTCEALNADNLEAIVEVTNDGR